MTIWKEISDHTSYEVSTSGEVRFIGGWRKFGKTKRYAPPSMRSPQPHSGGYLQLRLNKINFYVHILVATHFIPNPNKLPEVNHKDGNKHNNNVDNLEWCDRRTNQIHNSRELGKNKHSRVGRKISEKEFNSIKKEEGSLKQVAEKYNVSITRVLRIRNGLTARWY